MTRIVLDLAWIDSDMPHVLRDTAKRHREGRTGGYNVTAPNFLDLIADQIENPPSLIVLDLNPITARAVAKTLRENGWGAIPDDIEAQTKPARIPEPGLWGVVEASFVGQRTKQPFLRDNLKDNVGGGWVSIYGPSETGTRRVEWDSLIDPTLIREGIEATR